MAPTQRNWSGSVRTGYAVTSQVHGQFELPGLGPSVPGRVPGLQSRSRAALPAPAFRQPAAAAIPASVRPRCRLSGTPVIAAKTLVHANDPATPIKEHQSDRRIGQHRIQQRERVVQSRPLLFDRGHHAIECLDQIAELVLDRHRQTESASFPRVPPSMLACLPAECPAALRSNETSTEREAPKRRSRSCPKETCFEAP